MSVSLRSFLERLIPVPDCTDFCCAACFSCGHGFSAMMHSCQFLCSWFSGTLLQCCVMHLFLFSLYVSHGRLTHVLPDAEMNELVDKFGNKLAILAVPCNQFGKVLPHLQNTQEEMAGLCCGFLLTGTPWLLNRQFGEPSTTRKRADKICNFPDWYLWRGNLCPAAISVRPSHLRKAPHFFGSNVVLTDNSCVLEINLERDPTSRE